tara:strand:+ start:434 stop:1024 length:591 start_codon:yes stop_codon:yes gene_type:complete
MNIENLAENIESIIECAEAIKNDLEHNSGGHEEAVQLYEALDSNGTTTDSDEIIQAVEFYAELEGNSTTDLAKISEALGLLSRIEHGGHDPDDVLTALDVYVTVADGPIHLSDLEGALDTADEWSQKCGHTWESPGSMAQGFSDQCDIVSVFERVTGRNILSVEDAEKAVSLVGNLPAKERALLDAIKTFLSAVGQ